MKVLLKKIAFIGSVLLIGLWSFAQAEQGRDPRVRVIAELEQSKIRIGEQTELKVRLVFPKEAIATLTLPEDTLVQGVEILSSNIVDSTSVSDEIKELVYGVLLTSFDSATYQLHNIQAVVAGELYSAAEAPLLIVETVPVDLEHPENYTDIKAQWKPAFVWKDYILFLYLALLLIALVVGGYYGYQWWKKQKAKSMGEGTSMIRALDPYEEAMQSIMNLKAKELWEHHQIKEYYTELSEIIRVYLWRVYHIPTAERTSDEILDTFRKELGKDRMYEDLRKIFATSDLAKFAKYQPDADANVSLLFATQAFIEEHKPTNETDDEVTNDQLEQQAKGGEA